MNAAATEVVRGLVDVVFAYGQSDEFSFVFHESTTLFDRRSTKVATTVATMFTAEYCMQWPLFFPEMPLTRPYPTFDGRCVLYPTRKILRDYLSWRQADCHINNLYNTTFWNMVLKGGMSTTQAEEELKGSVVGDKNEILFSRFGCNYNNEPEVYRKGTVIYRAYDGLSADENGEREAGADGGKFAVPTSKTQMEKERKKKLKARIAAEHVDIIGDAFWEARPFILAGKKGDDDGE
jgi:tRNA(His) guanylyltransferase